MLNNSLNDCDLITEGSGANTKYYIQKGADTASKKLLGADPITISVGHSLNGSVESARAESVVDTSNYNRCVITSLSGSFYSGWHYIYNGGTILSSTVNAIVDITDVKSVRLWVGGHQNMSGSMTVKFYNA